ncbi:MAG TPA: hypothetical protein DEB05_13865, partial [Firmicutes bacterium]|nr:hypothetical protein [Bacillota bacterium]
GAQKNLVAVGDRGKIFRELVGEEKNQNGLKIKVCALTVENSQVIRRYFDFTNPISLAQHKTTFGLGDR